MVEERKVEEEMERSVRDLRRRAQQFLGLKVEYEPPKRIIQWGEYTGIGKFEEPSEMPKEMRDLLLKMLTVQADTEFASIEQHSDTIFTAPTPSDRVKVARIMVDEMRHGWQITQLLDQFGPEGRKAKEWVLAVRLGNHRLQAFNTPFSSWEDVLVFTFLVDRVGIYQLRAFEGSSYGPLARAIPTMLMEEQLHVNFGFDGLKRMLKDSYQGVKNRERAQKALNKWFPMALDMFGKTGSKSSEMAVRYGIKRWKNEEARQMYLREVEELINELGLEMPDPNVGRKVL
ncbi:hypothetical protein MetMK1DRAFT_00016440 [Metallosphaera yellowstonensis MK1]|uniref:Ring-1,2-phenylacetyl-CoA epoxidase subunit PaaA n=1 Tax=Metallosphaera yellowstonensis MK1 TaxID=671065 RepID=H2C144_9CREN|nr:Phenylacetic acid catabolic protein [Metallosphaera yellowstonensis]EHP71140.1 hypothetical protein MetMK1DRAFT_00016440 [Metallosphaera yellowstonensis MK1]